MYVDWFKLYIKPKPVDILQWYILMDCPFMIAPSVFSNVYIIQVHVVKYKSKMVFVVSSFSLSLHWFVFVFVFFRLPDIPTILQRQASTLSNTTEYFSGASVREKSLVFWFGFHWYQMYGLTMWLQNAMSYLEQIRV